MKEPSIELLFPTTVMFSDLDRDFTKEEISFVEKHSKEIKKNYGNMVSINSYILDEPEFANLKKEITEFVNVYLKKVYKPSYPAEAYITQSWLSFTKKGEYHHKHEHSNSFISGTLYINADGDQDKIYFHKNSYPRLSFYSTEFDKHNAESWWFPVYTGRICAFPSNLAHDVQEVVTEETRICLAFNTFIKGIFGSKENFTELKID
jgi:uncharacterized protein (TIGR02466 family)